MTEVTDTKARYGYGTIVLHWLLAALVLYLIWTGYEFMLLPRGPEKGSALQLHLIAGWIAIAAVVLRVVWRLANPLPVLSSGPVWQRHAARTVHWSLLILAVVLSITGYMAITAGRQPPSVLGLFNAPAIFGSGRNVHEIGETVHSWASHIFVLLIALHVAAAFKRTLIDKDGTLQRMLRIARPT